MTTPQVFVSHNHNDNDYCRAFVEALRQALSGTRDAVWYDEHNLGYGVLQQVIDQELLKRQHFIAILSPNAVASDWVKTEIYAALDLLRKGKMRTFQLVTAVSCDVSAVSPTLGGYKRIEQPGGAPFLPQAAAMRVYRVIPAAHGGDPQPLTPPPRETLPPLGPAPAPSNSTPALHLTPMPLYNLGFRGYSIGGVECILPPVCPVPGGVFAMGSDKSRDEQAYDNETPQYPVDVDGFAIGQHPVTVAEYACAVRINAVHEPPPPPPGVRGDVHWAEQETHPDHVVICVFWQEALAYARWLARLTGQPWRLPTEAEWEKAARGTDGRIYPWGDTLDKSRYNTDAIGSGTPIPVGHYPTGESPYHVQDMADNVGEWTSSMYKSYPYIVSDTYDDSNSTERRVLRGGSWDDYQQVARGAERHVINLRFLSDYSRYGFRLLLTATNS